MRFLSSYFLQGVSYSLFRDTWRGFFFPVDCRAAMNFLPLFTPCKRVMQNKVCGRIEVQTEYGASKCHSRIAESA